MSNTEMNQVCEGTNELVGFLYGELTDWETRKFERHMQDCASCKAEYARLANCVLRLSHGAMNRWVEQKHPRFRPRLPLVGHPRSRQFASSSIFHHSG